MKIYTFSNLQTYRAMPWTWVVMALLIAAAVVLVVLPIAGLVVALALGIAAIGIVALVIGLPLYLLGWFFLSLLMLPFGILKTLFWRRRLSQRADRQ